MRRRQHVPDINVVADQLLDDLRSDPRTANERQVLGISDLGAIESLDAVGTITSHEMTEDDLISLAIELAYRVIDAEREQTAPDR